MPSREVSPIAELFAGLATAAGAAKKIEAASDSGRCIVCNENPVVPPAKVCDDCADGAVDGAVKLAERAGGGALRRLLKGVLRGDG